MCGQLIKQCQDRVLHPFCEFFVQLNPDCVDVEGRELIIRQLIDTGQIFITEIAGEQPHKFRRGEKRFPIFCPHPFDIGVFHICAAVAFRYFHAYDRIVRRIGFQAVHNQGFHRPPFPDQLQARPDLNLVPLDNCLDKIRVDQRLVSFLRLFWPLRFPAQVRKDVAFLLRLWDVDFDQCDLHIRFALRLRECFLQKFDRCTVLFQLLRQLPPGVGAWIFHCFRIEQTDDLTAPLLHLDCFQQVLVPSKKRRVHHDQVIVLGGVIGQEVIMHHAVSLAGEDMPKLRVQLDCVNVPVDLVPAIRADGPHPLLGCIRQIPLARARLKYAADTIKIKPGKHIRRHPFGRRVKIL